MILLDGKKLSARICQRLSVEISQTLVKKPYLDYHPNLAAILVGHDPASLVYIEHKEKACLEVGIRFTLFNLPEETQTDEILEVVKQINQDPTIHGFLIQLPLPKHIDVDLVISKLAVEKDIDCFHSENIGNLVLNKPSFIPATPYGIKLLLEHYQIPTRGKHCVIVGKSLIVGQPLMNILSQETGMASTVTCCDRYTENLADHTSRADILIVGAGKHHLINTPDMIKEGATIIDVGIHRIIDKTRKSGNRLEGDVNFDAVKHKCKYITPVPGGVGPMTVATLLLNTWTAYQNQMN